MKKQLVVLLCAVICASCVATTGREFVRPTREAVELGKSTTSQIQAIYGQPYEQNTATISKGEVSGTASPFDPAPMEGTLTGYTYYLQQSEAPIDGGDSWAKWVDFVFLNDRLYVYNYVSNFKTGSTQFDESQLSKLKKGTSTKEDVVALFGEPGGRAVYPFVYLPGTEKYLYKSFEIDKSSNQFKTKGLELVFDPKGTLLDFRFGSQAKALPKPPPSAAPVFVPITVPAR